MATSKVSDKAIEKKHADSVDNKTSKSSADSSFTYEDHIFQEKLTSKEKSYFKTIDNYFKGKKIRNMCDIIEGESEISLRLLDFFVTKYAKKEKTRYYINTSGDGDRERFNVYIEYKAQLKSYKKRYFDPFRRKKKLIYKHKGRQIETSLCQLNFFKWAYSYGIIRYIRKHYDEIVPEMKKHGKETRTKNKKKKELKSQAIDKQTATKIVKVDKDASLLVAAKAHTTQKKVIITVSFDD